MHSLQLKLMADTAFPVVTEPSQRLSPEEAKQREERLEILRRLESETGAHIVVYFAGDRPNLQTVVAPDVQGILYGHLAPEASGKATPGGARPIGLYLYTIGGITTAAWALVNLLREFSDQLVVLIPYKAHSAGTLIALGADALYMSRMGQLSPVDASLNSPYNPVAQMQQPGGQPQFLPVSVESVIGYLNLARKEVNLHEDNALAAVVRGLTEKVHPLALGEVYRSRELSSDIATRLLKMGNRDLAQSDIDRIVDVLTKRMGSHNYTIGRKEARELLGPWVKDPTPEAERLMMKLYDDYRRVLLLDRNPSLEDDLGGQDQRVLTYVRAMIESTERLDEFLTVRRIQRAKLAGPGPMVLSPGVPVEGYQQTLLREGWFTVAER